MDITTDEMKVWLRIAVELRSFLAEYVGRGIVCSDKCVVQIRSEDEGRSKVILGTSSSCSFCNKAFWLSHERCESSKCACCIIDRVHDLYHGNTSRACSVPCYTVLQEVRNKESLQPAIAFLNWLVAWLIEEMSC